MMGTMSDLDYLGTMMKGYLEAMEFTEETDDGYLAPHHESLRCAAYVDCHTFLNENKQLLKEITPDRAGQDFWFTRNGHGVGFWDRDLGALGDALSEASERAGPMEVYMGDDGMLYASGRETAGGYSL